MSRLRDRACVRAVEKKRREIARPDPTHANHHLLAHAIATAVLLALVAALSISLLVGAPQPRRMRETRVSSVQFESFAQSSRHRARHRGRATRAPRVATPTVAGVVYCTAEWSAASANSQNAV